LSMMETSTLTGDIGRKTGQRQRDRRVHIEEEGGRLVDDGDIHIDGRQRTHVNNYSVNRARAEAVNFNDFNDYKATLTTRLKRPPARTLLEGRRG
jgi:hypothetical protein